MLELEIQSNRQLFTHPANNLNYPTAVDNNHSNPNFPLAKSISMDRIVIIGSSGSGKSTLARQLGQKLSLPVVHLDKLFWQPGWVRTPRNEWQQKVAQLAEQEKWIIDGNYRSTLPNRLKLADTVIFLDLPRWLCAARALKRRIQYANRPRPDMAQGCKEYLFDSNFPAFLRWIWDYPNRARPQVIQQITQLDDKKLVVWLRSTREVHQFLNNPHTLLPNVVQGREFYEFYTPTAR